MGDAPETPKLYRNQLTALFRANGLPPLSLSYLNKISSLGEGPPFAMIWNRRPMYDPDEALSWLRTKVEKQTQAARARIEFNREFEEKKRAKLADAVRAKREEAAA
jgi:hypothetical protein